MMIGLTLLGMLLVLVYAALNVGVRAWDSGDRKAAEAAHQRIVYAFLRRELMQIFAVRWRGTAEPVIAFEGGTSSLRFVTTLNLGAGFKDGGLQWGELYVAADLDDEAAATEGSKTLFLKREPFDLRAKDWDGLADAKPLRLVRHVKELELSYFGPENDAAEPTWRSEWKQTQRLPLLIKLALKTDDGRTFPELVVAPKLGEEAGCYDTGFQRACPPRRA
jgi:general secretion pathway protein J